MSTLQRLVGTWSFTMHHVAVPEPVTGTLEHRWVLDGAFLRQDWVYERPDFPDALSLFDEHSVHSFDVRGIARVFALTLRDDGWSMIRRDEDFWQRSCARFVDDDTIEASGENSFDQGVTWVHDFSMEYRRTAGRSAHRGAPASATRR